MSQARECFALNILLNEHIDQRCRIMHARQEEQGKKLKGFAMLGASKALNADGREFFSVRCFRVAGPSAPTDQHARCCLGRLRAFQFWQKQAPEFLREKLRIYGGIGENFM